MTDECYCRFLYDSEPFSIAVAAGRQGYRAGGRFALEDLRHDRLAHRLRPGAGADDRRDAASCRATPRRTRRRSRRRRRWKRLRGPQDSVDVMLAEYRKRRDFVVERLRAIPGVTIGEPKGAFYAYPNISRALERRHPDVAAVRREAAEPTSTSPWCRARPSAPTTTSASPTRLR